MCLWKILSGGVIATATVLWAGVAWSEDPRPIRSARTSEVTTAPAKVSALTVDTLEAIALQNNPTLAQSAAAIDQARGVMRQVSLYPNPQVGYVRSDANHSGKTRTSGIFIGQEIVTAKKLQKSRDVEAWEVQRLTWEQQAQQSRVLNDVRVRFIETLAAQQAMRFHERLSSLAEEGLATTERLKVAQVATQVDVLQARIQSKTFRVGLREAESRYRSAWKQLANVAGLPELAMSELQGSLDGEIPELDFDQQYARLLDGSPQLRASESRIQHACHELRRELAQPYPNLSVQVVAERDHVQQFDTVSTLLSVPLPIFNRNQGNIDHARADVREAQAEVRRAQLALRDQLADVFQRYETAKTQVLELRDEILPDAEESLKLTTAGYRSGEVSFSQVLAVRQTFGETHLAYLAARADLRKSLVELDGLLLTGGLNPAEVGTALQSSPGAGVRRGVLNQLREGQSKQVLPPALQTGP